MSPRLNELKQLAERLNSMYIQGRLPEVEYKKGLVALAHDYIELGEHEEAVSMIGKLDADYVDNVLPVQMETEPEFRVVAVALGRLLRASADPVDLEVEQALAAHVGIQGKPC